MKEGPRRRLSLPSEHGGYLTVAAATAGAALLAPAALPAAGAGLAVAAGFLARGPVERFGNPHGLREWDRAALLLLATFVAGGAALAGSWMVAAAALAVPAAALLARRLRAHRAAWFELAGMAALGATAALAAWRGSAPLDHAAVLGVVLAAHSAAAVPLVRTQLRRRERAGARTAALQALAVTAAGFMLVAAIGHPAAGLALVPRVLQIADRLARGPRPTPATMVGIRETLLLTVATVVSLLACS